MKYIRWTTAIAAATTLAACSSNNNRNAADTSATAMRTDTTAPAAAMPTPQTPTPTTTDTTAANNAASSNIAMSDANLLAKAEAGDSAEVAVAKYMMLNTKSAGVRSFADLLQRDHGKGISQVETTAKKASITPQAPANDTTAQAASHFIDQLKRLNGNDRDTALVNHEIADHQEDISNTKAAVGAAQNADVKALLQKELPELQKHLDRAQALSKQLASKK